MLKRLCLKSVIIALLTGIFLTPSYADYNSFTVNMPNSQGGYTSLVIKQSGNGYIGPKGEYYSSFPTVFQLQAVYSSDEIQSEKMLDRQADQSVESSQQKIIRQQQLMDQRIQQNIKQQQVQQLAREQAQLQAQEQSQQQTKQLLQQQQAQIVSRAIILKTQDQSKQNAEGDGMEVFLGILILLYFVPSIIAFSRRHLNSAPILLVNIFLGWTFLGWVVALVWSFSHQDKRS